MEQRVDDAEYKLAVKHKAQQLQKDRGEPAGTHVDDVVIDKVFLWEVEHLGGRFSAEGTTENRMRLSRSKPTNVLLPILKGFNDSVGDGAPDTQSTRATEYNKLITSHECILADLVRKPEDGNTYTRAYVRAGPRKHLHFNPSAVNAAIVTCGGLCPGLNNVVREITNTLHQLYCIGGKVYGIRGGYKGFYDPDLPPVELTPALVEDIHHQGGTFLGSSRGGFDLEKTLEFIKAKKIKQVFVIGGDGTHRGAFRLHEGCMEAVSALERSG